ncbi:acyltransferase family protein [Roseovarius sp. THAF9]|uniref:acyltransferase family protein n=1 Tax=Roseovarius sp. THAF9 TaxID=2587847 RepID=UPI001268E678|nr:acyltransferase family protein [Roseovarius sp. THAF9]
MIHGYRAEIDGLRAIAIIPVVLFHFNLAGLQGGFVGVDVFFVISGFLIGGILWDELRETGRIRLGRFFLRRVRRLAPAYYVMAFASFIAAWFILLPFEFREFGKELIAATVYLSNVLFWRSAGYFDVLGEERVLLHTWSLAVEEQFYLFLPLFLLLLARARTALPWVLSTIGLVSLAACIVVTETSATTAFYLFPFRAWELLAGVLLAIYGRESGFKWEIGAWVSWAGLALILLAVLMLEPGDAFPGALALLPVAGTVLMIANGKQANPVNRVLTTPVFLFFGAISYSLYLWHWPIVTLAKYYTGDALGLGMSVVLIAISVAVAWLSLKLVENPVRRSSIRAIPLFSGYLAASAVVLGVGFVLYSKDGLIERFGPTERPAILATRDFLQDWSRCHTPSEGAFSGIEICPIGPEGAPRVLIWGDSHARAFKEGLEHLAFQEDVPGILIWRAGCPPLLGLSKTEKAATAFEDAACTQSNQAMDEVLSKLPGSIDAALLLARWTYYADGRGIGADAQNRISLSPAPGARISGETAPELLVQAFGETIQRLSDAGAETFVLRQAPEIFDFGAREMARALVYGQMTLRDVTNTIATTSRRELKERNASVDAILADLGVPIIDIWPRLCSGDKCSALQGSEIFYFDNNHVTNTGAIALSNSFKPVFDAAGDL